MFDGVSELIEQLDAPEFTGAVLEFVYRQLVVDHMSVFLLDPRLVPRLIAAQSYGSEPLAARAGRAYEQSLFYRHDPNTELVRSGSSRENAALVIRLRAADISDALYRSTIYDSFGLIDRLSILARDGARWLVINFYRDLASGEFSALDIDRFSALARLLKALLFRHFALLPPQGWQAATLPEAGTLEGILQRLGGSLSARESQVCARALLGMTNIGIGLDLGVKTSTVETLRKRAFAKLQISSLNELFALCLGCTLTR